jgi:hypothetical protein
MKGSPAVAYVPFYDKRNGNPLSMIVAVSIKEYKQSSFKTK